MTDTFYDFTPDLLNGTPQSLADYAGKVVLVVNTASKCGFTPQFEGLESLWQKYRDQGLVILGFPCNQFLSQDPGSNDEIGEFCTANYGVSFPMFSKIDVNGADTAPVYRWLKDQKGGVLGDRIKWNFTKFLIGRDGRVILRAAPATKPEDLAAEIEKALAETV